VPEMRWLRTEWMKPVDLSFHPDIEGSGEGLQMQFLRALRTDGQLFQVNCPTNSPDCNPETMRIFLDTMLDSPALPPYTDSDGNTFSEQMSLDSYENTGNWIEENEHASTQRGRTPHPA
jgi:hypothetical protein